jgi:hypothetical protein
LTCSWQQLPFSTNFDGKFLLEGTSIDGFAAKKSAGLICNSCISTGLTIISAIFLTPVILKQHSYNMPVLNPGIVRRFGREDTIYDNDAQNWLRLRSHELVICTLLVQTIFSRKKIFQGVRIVKVMAKLFPGKDSVTGGAEGSSTMELVPLGKNEIRIVISKMAEPFSHQSKRRLE